ncbi:putative enterotoxin [Cordyceps sp. RAO-2017]|nr:putative enterotoxin [Cordyceps sp. RAO-2017]
MIFSLQSSFVFSAYALWLAFLSSGQAGPLTPRDPDSRGPAYVYRGDTRSPAVLRAKGGFHPFGRYEDDDNAFNIENHLFVDLGFMNAVSENFDTCDGLSDEEKLSEATNLQQNWTTAFVSTTTSIRTASDYAHGRWVYLIHVTPNMIMLPENLDDEIVALGGILWSQVRGYRWVGNEELAPPSGNPGEDDRFTRSPDYVAQRLDWTLPSAPTAGN